MIRRTVVALAALAASLCAAPALHAASFVVSTNADTGAGSLRAAIDASNTNPGIDTISFDLQFAESTITPATDLPQIADPANIDGTIPGPVNGTQHVRLDGSALGATGVGLDFHSGSATQSVLRGLAITSFGQVGVQLGVDNVLVAGDLIGTDASGETGLGNGTGIASDGPSQIGSTNKGDGNVISGNLTAGIRLDPGASSRILGNFVGTQDDGASPLGNTGPGILVDQGATNVDKIGGTDAGEGNVIAFNETGVLIQGSGFGDTIRGNSIFSNSAAGGIGIDLAPAGVTQNDPGDTDTGPNDLQNFPDVTGAFALAGGRVEVTGTVTGSRPAGSLYAVDFFAGASCNPSGHGEGERYLGSVSVPEGAFDTKAALPGTASAGEIVTATATDDLGDTSEFSQCTQVAASSGRTFVVNTTADHDDGTCDVEDCSLREAIEAADANPGPDAISFDIAPGGLQTIQLQAALGQLPFVTGPVTIDGTTQPGTGPGPGIEVDGEQLEEANGLQVTSGGSTIRGLVLNRFSSSAIVLQDVGGNVVSGNYIGTNATGTSDAANGTGIEISQSPDNLIGGSTAADGNVISGNVVGITISNGPSTGNRVQGNIIGLDAGGTQALATFADPMDTGILVNGGAGSTTIGGTSPGQGNVISGQGQDAIEFDTTQDNVVEGNFIGTDKTGTSLPGGLAVAQDTGVAIQNTSSHNFIGGPSAGANVIAGQTGDVGVQVDGESTDNTVVGNFIGTDPGGTQNLANAGGVRILNTSETNTVANNTIRFSTDDGVQIDSGPNTIVGNTITDGAQAGIRVVGGTTTAIGVPGTGNVLSSNAFGIVLSGSSSSTKVLGNRIGTDAGGTLDRGNADSGILVVGSNDNQIGGTAAGEGNTVAFNGIDGVEVDSGTGNAIRGNSIFSNKGEPNDGLGIDLDAGSASGPFGVNPNDPGDPDTGANELQNYPVLSDVSSGGEGGTTIDGTLNSVGGTTYHLDFYSSPACDPSGNGEGRTYIGSQDVLTNAAGDAPFTAAFPVVDVSGGNAVTATATDPSGNTSEFSACATVAASGGALTGSVSVDPPANAFDLTAIGTIDWAVWGFASGGTSTSLAPDVRKATVAAPAISDLTNIDPAPSVVLRGLGQFTSAAPFFFDWSDGTSPAVAESATGGIQHDGQQQALSTLNHGFAFDVPADTTSRTLTVFVATNRADGQLTATLSDGSAPPFVDTLPHATDARSGVYTITYAAGSPGQTLHVEWVESLDNCAAFHCDNAAIDAVALAPASPPPILANVTLTAPDTTTAGAGKVKLADVPPSALLQPQSSAESTPVNETPVNETPVNETPVNELPVNELPVNEIPVNETSIHGLGLNFASLSQSIPALGDITLNTIPLLRPGGWTAALAETPLAALALQNVTLRDYYALPADENPETRPTDPIPRITLGDLDLTRSPLGGLPASSIVLANVPLSDMRSLAAWCDLFGPVYCPTPPGSTQLAGQSVLAASLQGAPVNETPVNETPVNETPVNEIPVNEVPVNETPVNEVPVNELPVNETPVNETNLAGTPVNELPVNEISPRSSPVNETTLDELPVNEIMAANSTGSPVYEIPVNELETRNDVIFCAVGTPGPGTVDCSTATLGDAFAANAIRPGVTLGDLLAADGGPPDALAGIKVGDLHYFGTATDPVTFRALVDSFPDGTITLGDYFLLVLRSPTAQQGLAWEHLDLAGSNLPAHATDAPKMLYQASFDVGAGPLGAIGLAPTEVDVNLPAGFDYVPGSSEIVQKPGTCDSAVALADPSRATPGKLSWTVPAVVGEGYVICFDARPGITLGPRATGLDATTTGGATGSALTSTAVGDTFEPNDSPATATPITTDEFLLSYLTSSDDVDYYTFDPGNSIAAGSRVTVHLSHLPADYDLVVYGPSTPPLSPSDGTGVPLDGEPLTDDVPRFTHSTDVLPSQSLDDLNLQPGLPMVGVSASRGNDPEDVVFTYDGSGPYTIQITGYNGATSGDPYMLRVQTAPPLTASTVPGFPSGTTQGPELGTLPTGLNTVFVVNQEQLSGQYGETAAQNVTDAVKNHLGDMATLGFPSAILSVDRITDVEAKYAAWDANPGDPTLANAVVRSINVAIDQQIRQQPGGAGLKYIVLVGGDRVIPFARLSDFTAAANETGYASMFDQNTDLFSSLALGNFLSDDPYGDLNPVPYLTRQLYIPELAVGRLVETPNQIIGAIARFAGSNGQLVPQTSLTTGYDFLTDGATRVKTAFDNRLGSGSVGLISDTWDRTQLLQDLGLVPATAAGMPSLVSINGHADHYRLQPPGGATGTAPAPLFTTTDLAGSSAPRINRIVFGMGCHAGLSVPDSIVTADPSVSTLDWPEAYMGWQTGTGADPDANAQQFGVGAYLGNTGYGYGDTVTVAYSEEINQLFAQRIAGGSSVGDALTDAKQAYFGGRGVFGVYDEKAMGEFTLYGMPMWSVSAAPHAPAPAPAPKSAHAARAAAATASNPLVTDPSTGLEAETFDVDPVQNTPQPNATNTKYWSGADGVQVSQYRPIEPKTYVPLDGTTVHGALITALSSEDHGNFDPVYARPTVDLSTNEPELSFGDVAFPSRIQAVRTFQTSDGGRAQRVVLVTGQFFRDSTTSAPDAKGTGVQRLFTRIAGRAFRSASTDYFPPAFRLIQAVQAGSSAAFTVKVSDLTPTGDGTVKRVLVGVRSGDDSDWTFADLVHAAATTRWTGTVPISGTGFEFFAQAVDASGNVAVSTNKGFYFKATPPATGTGGVIVKTTADTPPSGWFDGSADVEVTVNDAAPLPGEVTVSVDGGEPQPYAGPVHVTGDGPHTVSAVTATGSDETTVLVDASPPTVDVATPADGAVFAQDQPATAAFACNDAGIGVDSCASNGPAFSTATIGVHTFTVAATDKLGKPTTRTVSYEVKPAVDAFVSSGTQGANGWYVTPPTITAQSPAGSAPPADAVTYTVNGASPQPYTGPFQVTAEGTSNLVFSAYGHTKPLTVKVDTTLPQITIATPPAGASYPRSAAVTASYACVETTPSAPAPSCSATVTPPSGPAVSVPSGSSLPTDLQGSYRMVVSSTDESGKTATLTRSYTVGTPQPLTGIVFTRSNRIWTIGADGTGLRQLTGIPGLDPGSFLDDQAARSPDGRKIVFARRPTASAPAQLWMIDPDGRNPVQLTSDGDNTAPAWSSDGTRIAFQSTRSGSNGIDIWSAAWNGGALSNLTDLTNADGDDVTPSWSPASGLNSGKIVFASSRRPHGQFEIYSMTTSGANQTRLTNDPRTDREPAWSPDGSKIAFSSDRAGGNGGFEIYVMGAPYGNNQARMTTLGGDDAAPFWFNPTRLLFSSTQIGPAPLGGLAFISPSGGAPTKLANTAPGDTNPG